MTNSRVTLIPFYFWYCRFKTICEWEADSTMHHSTQCHVMIHGRKRRSLFHIKVRDLGVECRKNIPNAGKSIDHKYCLPFRSGHMQFLIDLRFTGDCAGEVCKSQNRCNCKWMSSSGYKTNLRQFISAQSLSLFILSEHILVSFFPNWGW
jgi:hypothetical protein